MKKAPKSKTGVDELQGWQEIAAFLGQPVAIAQRWARSEGMPAERKGRYVYASREKLNHWLGRESSGNLSRFQLRTRTLRQNSNGG